MGTNWEYVLTEVVYRRFSRPLAQFLARFDVDPNHITIVATLTGMIPAFLMAYGMFYEAIVAIFISQILDCTDGDLARLTGKTTRKGAYLDRVMDRFVDAALIMGLVAVNPEYWLLGMLALTTSFGVSITRVMAEAEGAVCKVGVGGRDTRLLIIMLGLLFGAIYETLVVLTVLGAVTTVHRMIHSLKQLD
ncbi:CDP-alcohol phosphatidyltransferase family protein [Archaeoglobus veneficus]|uniref:CDP-alcohol phosphatidyltransferase n=1 Tax=Archaeoglobus veneficus (strain DSM 11195 / SNP6) TaxID=693661 RepID=F2KNW5_ARCVS|nr:CDP-alcohol phosphatidyltransferase family protein [Archaeoglobus veneficus]AEA47442.1 CDP-alcohol phosphatidyltransferase [Archaeoglobus veneficus SNP6]